MQYPPLSSFLGAIAAAKLTRARLYPYFHNTYQEIDSPNRLIRWFARKIQSHLFKVAKHVFVISDGLVEYYKELYPNLDCSALVHTFDGPIPEFEPPPEPGSPVKLVFFGNVNESCLDAVGRGVQAVRNLNDAELIFLSATLRVYLERWGLIGQRTTCFKVPEDEIALHLSQADIVFLPHGFTGSLTDVEYRTIFPTKTIQYLLSRRPILAHCPPNCFLWRFLRDNDCALVVDKPDVAALDQAITRLRTNPELRASLVRNALKAAEKFQGKQVAAHMREQMSK